MEPLSGPALTHAAQPWLAELGKSDRDRLQKLLLLPQTKQGLRLADCLHAIYPNDLPQFTAFRTRINKAAAEHKIPLKLLVDSKKKNPPTERYCWFTGPDQTEQFSRQVTEPVTTRPYIPTRGIYPNRQPVHFFVSYKSEEAPLVDQLLAELKNQFGPSLRYELSLWQDKGRILLGERWHESIQQALHACDFGLLFVSPAFLTSGYIQRHELPVFVGPAATKPVLPVALRKLSDKHNLLGLEHHQLFFHKSKPYADHGAKGRATFAETLYEAIEQRLGLAPGVSRGVHSQRSQHSTHHPDATFPHPPERKEYIRTKGIPVSFHDSLEPATPQQQGRDALAEIDLWLKQPNSPMFALLGEYGMGKTTTLQKLTRDLLLRRQHDAATPLPIYIDLRDYSEPGVPTIEPLLQSVIERSFRAQGTHTTPQQILHYVREEGALIIFDGLDEKIVHLAPGRAKEFIRTLWSVLPPNRGKGKMIISCRSHYFRDVWSQAALFTGEDREGVERKTFPAFCLLPFNEEQIREYLTALFGADKVAPLLDLIATVHNLKDLAQRPYLLSLIATHAEELERLKLRGEPVNAARLYELVVRNWLERDEGKHQLQKQHKRRLMEDLAAALWRDGAKQWTADRLEEWLDEFLLAHPAIARAYAQKDEAVLKEDLRTATFVVRPEDSEQHFRFAHTSLQEFFLASYLVRALNASQPDQAWDLPLTSLETLDFVGQLLQLDPAGLPNFAGLLDSERLNAARLAFRFWLRAVEKDWPQPAPTRVRLPGADLEEWTIKGVSLRAAILTGARLSRARLEDVDLSHADLSRSALRQAVLSKVRVAHAKLTHADLSGSLWREGIFADADLTRASIAGCQWVEFSGSASGLPDGWDKLASVANIGPAMLPQETTWFLNTGHSYQVQAFSFSSDGERLLSGSADRTLKLWDTTTGQCLLSLGHADSVSACAISSDRRLLVSGSEDGTMKLWEADSGLCIQDLVCHKDRVSACAVSLDGLRLLSYSGDTLKLWDAKTGQCILTVTGLSSGVNTCLVSADGARIRSGQKGNALRLYDADTGQCLLTLTPEEAQVPKRQSFAQRTTALHVSDAETNHCMLIVRRRVDESKDRAINSDGEIAPSRLNLPDDSTRKRLKTPDGRLVPTSDSVFALDGRLLLTASLDGTLKIWDAKTGQCLRTLFSHANHVATCAFSGDGKHLLSGSWDATLKLWDAATGNCLRTLSGHAAAVSALAFSQSGRHVVSASWDKTLRLWEAETGECIRTFSSGQGAVFACAISANGRRLLSGGMTGTLKLWDAETGECLLTLAGDRFTIYSCAISPDGRRLLSGGLSGILRLWDAETGKCLRVLEGPGGTIPACAFSADGRRLLAGSQVRSLRLWDAATGRCLRTLSGHSAAVYACAFSPRGDRALSGSSDKKLKLWDTKSGRCLRTFSGHGLHVSGCAVGPDGSLILSSSWDNTLKLWDAQTGECLKTFHHLPENATATFAHQDGRDELLHCSGEAWRWLAHRWRDPRTGRLRLLPAEHFGPLPGLDPVTS